MIARIWHGVVSRSRSDEYLENQSGQGFADYLATKGNKGLLVLRRNEGDKTHFLLVTLWESTEAIAAFAGKEIEKARYYEDDKEFLLELEPNVLHYEVALETI